MVNPTSEIHVNFWLVIFSVFVLTDRQTDR